MTEAKPCTTPDCGKPARARGLCGTCYRRWLRATKPSQREPSPRDLGMHHSEITDYPSLKMNDRDWHKVLKDRHDIYDHLLDNMAKLPPRPSEK